MRELALAASRKAEKRPVNRVIEDWKAVDGGGGYYGVSGCVHRLQDPYPIWAKALVAAYLAEEGFLRGR